MDLTIRDTIKLFYVFSTTSRMCLMENKGHTSRTLEKDATEIVKMYEKALAENIPTHTKTLWEYQMQAYDRIAQAMKKLNNKV